MGEPRGAGMESRGRRRVFKTRAGIGEAVAGIDLRVGAGEVYGFLGPNGAGKTTTLKLLMQLVYPTAGRAEILGRPLGDLSVKRRIGYLPENPYFYDHLTAEELLVYYASLFGIRGAARASLGRSLPPDDGLPARHVDVDAARGNGQARRVDVLEYARPLVADFPVDHQKIAHFIAPAGGIDDAAVADERVHGVAMPPQR